MYTTKCSHCGRTFETEHSYFNFVCGECTQKMKDEEAAQQKQNDLAALERARRELEKAQASGDEEAIRRATNIYNNLAAVVRSKYGF